MRWIALRALGEPAQYPRRHLVRDAAVGSWFWPDALDKVFVRVALMECYELIAVRWLLGSRCRLPRCFNGFAT